MSHCVIIPTYNNAATLLSVLHRVQQVCSDVIVVNDGSTDDTAQLLQQQVETAGSSLTVVAYSRNRGKGYALKQGFEKAREMGFDYAVTIDSDGQHFPEDIPSLLSAMDAAGTKEVLVVGSRDLAADGMPAQNTFANRFSNFWFRLQTGISLPDTQTGFRLYPLHRLPSLGWISNRYESELALLVLSAWNGVSIISCPVRVYYPPQEERVSHFRPFWDFFRISVLNTLLTLLAPFACIRRWIIEKSRTLDP